MFTSSRRTNPILNWEKLQNNQGGPVMTYRSKIPGGWLVTTGDTQTTCASAGAGITFVPDPNHEWNGYSLASNNQY